MASMLKVQLSHGRDKYEVLLESHDITVEELAKKFENVTGVPVQNQKLIFKGRSLSVPEEKLVTLGIVNNSKLMLLGRKFNERDEQFLKSMIKVEGSLKTNEASISDIQKRYTDTRNGYLPSDLHSEAYSQMMDKVSRHIEQLTKLLETLDSMTLRESSTEVQNKRRSLVRKIQECLSTADGLQKCLEQSGKES